MSWLTENKEIVVKNFVRVSIVLIAGCIGFRLGASSRSGKGSSSLWSEKDSHANLMRECQSYDEEFGHGRSPASVEGREADYFGILEKNHLEEKGRRMAGIFPRTEIGYALAQETTLVDFGPTQSSPEGRIVADDLKYLESSPQESFGEIKESMGRVGGDLAAERQFLFQLVARLDLEITEKLDFFSDQLSKVNTVQDPKQYKLNCSVILLAMMQLGADPAQLDSSLRQVLAGQSSYNIRSFLISIYESKYPEEGKRIRSDLGMLDM